MTSRLVPAVVLASLLLLSPAGRGSTGERSLVPSGVAQQAASAGSARVIVRLNVPFTPEAGLGSAALVLGQRQAIAASRSAVTSGLRGTGHRVVRDFDQLPLVAIEASPDALRMLDALHGLVAEVVEDELHAPMLSESVPLVEATQAQSLGFDGTGTIVAILDTGVDRTHTFFGGGAKIVGEACFSSTTTFSGGVATSACPGGVSSATGTGTAAPCTAPGCYHGTHVAGIAAGGTTNVPGSGVAPGARILAVQIFSNITGSVCGSAGACTRTFTSDQIAGLNHVYNVRNSFPGQRIVAVNMSLGGGRFFDFCDTSLQKPAIDQLRAEKIATVIASGNDGFTDSMSAPACISSAVSVGSTTKADAVSSFSNVAPFLNLFAPGSSIVSSLPGNTFGALSGTSMATPHVAGAFAILRQGAPEATVDQVLAALQGTGKPIADVSSTHPRIRVFTALQAVSSPDLVVQALTPSPAKALAGATVNVTATVRNAGLAPAPASVLRVYFSTDGVITAGDTPLGQVTIPALGSLASATRAVAVSIPPGTPPGAYFIGAIVDGDGLVAESSDANNSRAAAFQVIQPDLLVTALSSPAQALTSRPLAIASTVRNRGTAPAGPFRVAFYMAQGDDTPGAGVPIGFRDLPGGVAASTNSSATTTLTIPANLSAGTYFLSARVDSLGAVNESDEANNGLTATSPVTVSLFRPDLLMTALSSPAQGQTGRPLVVTNTVRNQGPAPAGPFRVNVYLAQGDSTPGAGRLVGVRSISSLAASTNSSAATTLTLPANLSAGTYFLSAVADPMANVELPGDNNGLTAASPVTVTLFRPELTMTALGGPSAGKIGKTISVTSAVRNTGPAPATAFKIRFYVSSTSSTPGDGIMIGTRDVVSLAVGANVSAATTLTIPANAGLTEGNYHLSAVADTPPQGEIDPTNNGRTAASQIALTLLRPDLTVTAATAAPALASPGFTVNVTNTVKNVGDAPTASPVLVRFYLSPSPALAGGEPVIGSRSIAAALAVNGMSSVVTPVVIPHGTTPGTYFIVVQANADGSIVEYPGSNNGKATGAVNVQRPNLQIVSIAPPKAVIRGKGLAGAPTAAVVVKNIGAGPSVPFDLQVYARRDDGVPGAGTPGTGDLMFTKTIATLAPSATTTVMAPVAVDETVSSVVRRAGNYFISAVADGAANNDDAVPGDNSLTGSLKVAVLPDVKKLKTASVAVTLGGCSAAGTTLNLTGSFSAGSQTVSNPSTFTATMPLQDPSLGFSQTYRVTGTVESVDIQGTAGKVKTTFTYTGAGPAGASTGKGNIDAAVPDRSLAGALSGSDKSTETCTFSGTLSIDPLP